MHYLIAAATVALLAIPAHADTMAHRSAAWNAMAAADKATTTYQTYAKTCLAKGYTATSAASSMAGPAPAGATGQCKDGTYTMSKTHTGAYSSHGGVAKWI
jgi:hypothetical protein